jgi:hypothetical protein
MSVAKADNCPMSAESMPFHHLPAPAFVGSREPAGFLPISSSLEELTKFRFHAIGESYTTGWANHAAYWCGYCRHQ